jgi:hypothetical protein
MPRCTSFLHLGQFIDKKVFDLHEKSLDPKNYRQKSVKFKLASMAHW